MTTKPEHDAPEQPTAANYTAGDSFAKIVEEMQDACGCCDLQASAHEWAERIEALAASHRERSVHTGRSLYEAYYRINPPPAGTIVLPWELSAYEQAKWNRIAELVAASQPADKTAGQADVSQPLVAPTSPSAPVTDAQIEAALDTKVGLDHTLRSLIRGDTVVVGWSKADVVRKLLEALAPEPATAGVAPLYTHPVAATVRDASIDPALTLDVARELLADCARAIDATPAAAVPDISQAALARDGMVLVPRGPTRAMADAALYALDEEASAHAIVEEVYAAMIAAAPANRPADNSQPTATREAQRGVPDTDIRWLIKIAAQGLRATGATIGEKYVTEDFKRVERIADVLAASPADISQPAVVQPLPASGANVVCDLSEVSLWEADSCSETNCRRCQTHPNHRDGLHHAGL